MRIGGRHYRSIWRDPETGSVSIIDQRKLPHALEILDLRSLDDAVEAIRTMQVRGAPLIGATAAHGLAIVAAIDPSDASLASAAERLAAARPTAVNLVWALERVMKSIEALPIGDRADRALREALRICEEDVSSCARIGEHGLSILRDRATARAASGRPVTAEDPLQIMTHCNAGWLATVDWGTAIAPIYKAHEVGLPVHVWVGETRPRNQGASLTAFELREMEIPHTVFVDNAAGHLIQRGHVDAVIVGSDRTTARGDVCNKIGTYLRALAAKAKGVPFYVALPCSTIDWSIEDGVADIPIEERSGDEVRRMTGLGGDGRPVDVALFDAASPTANPAFDVTPADLVTALITEHGVCEADRDAMAPIREQACAPDAHPA